MVTLVLPKRYEAALLTIALKAVGAVGVDSKMALVHVVAQAVESKLFGADRRTLGGAGSLWHTYIAHT